MIRPAAFDYNPETAATNRMQQAPGGEAGRSQDAALAEFERMAKALSSEGIEVCVVPDTPEPSKPDAVFPNNWVSFHQEGTVVLYPLQSASRRPERRRQIIDAVCNELGYTIARIVDLTHHEEQQRYLEGTGSLVLDHTHRIAYACVSPRTHPQLVEEWAQELGYQAVIFEARDPHGVPYYHTNVLLCIGTRMAVVGACAMPTEDRARVVAKLALGGREVLEINYEEIARFAGNMLELASWDEALGDYRLLVMSDSARKALRPETYARLSAAVDGVLAIPVPTIERLGGGSVRCMLAEVFLPSVSAR